jgi:serine/threonine protein kinase
MPTPANLAHLSAEDRRQVEACLAEFQQSWNEKRLGVQIRKLPPPGSPARRAALVELVKIDLARQWQIGRRVKLESYLKALPELGTADSIAPELIEAEMAARRSSGATLHPADLVKRFPRQADALKSATSPEAETLPPGGPSSSTGTVDAPSRPAPAPASLPERFGRYRILRQLGKGGMGTVYLARDTELDRQVALKVPRFADDTNPAVIERFAREARAAAGLAHPNLCPVFDVGQIDGIRYVTMAYIEGQPLSELIGTGKPLPQRAAAALVRKLALAMQEAHAHGVIHRDLKPANIIVNKKNEPVITDFGLARRAQEDVRLTQSGSVLGTPAYMSPEQVDGDSKAIGPATDVYSLGVILYELLTGQLPFRGSVPAVLAQIMTAEPPPPRTLCANIDPALEAICLKAMAKKTSDRHDSMSALAGALSAYLKEDGATAPMRQSATRPSPAAAPAAALAPAGSEVLATQLLARLANRLDADAETIREAQRHRTSRWPLALGALGLLVALGVIATVAIILANRQESPSGPPIVNVKTDVSVQLPVARELADPTIVMFVLDGEPISKESLAAPIKLKAGLHALKIKRSDGREEIRDFNVGETDDGGTVALLPPEKSPEGVKIQEPTKKERQEQAKKEQPFVQKPQPVLAIAKVDGPAEGDWVPLFNSKDLDDWSIYPEGTAGWDIKDGVLVGEGPVSTLLSKHGWYRNFHVRMEAMVNDGGRGALYFRAKYRQDIPIGYLALINSTAKDWQANRTGALGYYHGTGFRIYQELRETPVAPDTWFTQEVIAQGNQLIVKVNDRETANYLDRDNTLKKGFFALERPTREAVLKVRKLEIKELNPYRPFVPPGHWEGFTPLFNGKDLDGWKGYPKETTGWEVKDGLLVGSGPASHLFSERGDYRNFHFRVEARINHGGLSGQGFRSKYGAGIPIGYIAVINSTNRQTGRTGSLFHFHGTGYGPLEEKRDTLIKPDVWFNQEVIAKDRQFIIKVDGEEIVNKLDPDDRYKRGHLALLRHDGDTVVTFRTIEIKELPAK